MGIIMEYHKPLCIRISIEQPVYVMESKRVCFLMFFPGSCASPKVKAINPCITFDGTRDADVPVEWANF